jgi:hypothetical protein
VGGWSGGGRQEGEGNLFGKWELALLGQTGPLLTRCPRCWDSGLCWVSGPSVDQLPDFYFLYLFFDFQKYTIFGKFCKTILQTPYHITFESSAIWYCSSHNRNTTRW